VALLLPIVLSGVAFLVGVSAGKLWLYEKMAKEAAREQAQLAVVNAERLTWKCPECGTSASGHTVNDLAFVWNFHDREIACSTKWDL